MERDLGVTGPQRFALRVLGQAAPLAAGQLAEKLSLHPSTLTGILERLTASGLVERRPDPADARRAVLCLSEAGHRVNRRKAGTVEAAVRKTIDASEPTDVVAAGALLRRLVAELEG